ncbi:MAG: AMP-binding protein [Bdellovibrionota bacterium]
MDFVSQQKSLEDHFIFQSSGTTGNPKWVALSHRALEVSAQSVNKHLELSSKDIFGLALPDFHVGGFGLIERARVAGATLKKYPQDQSWNALSFHKWLVEERISVTSLVPAQVFDLEKAQLKAPSTLKNIVVGGGALPAPLYFAARTLGWPLLISYGLTECASQVATAGLSSLKTPPEEKIWPDAELLSHFEAQAMSHQVVALSGESLLSCYIKEETSSIFVEDPKENGLFILPDKVELCGRVLSVSGRREDEYKILGEWVRWSFLKKTFAELFYESSSRKGFKEDSFFKFEIEIFSDDRRGNKIALLCNEFDENARKLVSTFNAVVFPFERITHYYEGNLPRSELGKVLRLKINPLCLKEISE